MALLGMAPSGNFGCERALLDNWQEGLEVENDIEEKAKENVFGRGRVLEKKKNWDVFGRKGEKFDSLPSKIFSLKRKKATYNFYNFLEGLITFEKNRNRIYI